MSELMTAIRTMLNGHDSKHPVPMADLLKLGKNTSDTLDKMQSFGEINCALINGRMAYWITGASASAISSPFRRDPANMHPDPANMHPTPGKVKPTASINHKESPMPRTNPISIAVLEIITEQPGTTREALIELALKRAPEATEVQANKALMNLIHSSKKVMVETLADGTRVIFPNDGTARKAAPGGPKKTSKTKPTKAKAAKPTEMRQLRPLPDSELEAARDDFNIMLDESLCVRIKTGSVTSVLTPADADRVYRFIGRIHKLLEAGQS